MLYIDPLGNKIELTNYSNKKNNLRKNNILNNARLEDIEKRYASNKITFIIYSVFACIFIIMFLFFLKKLNR